MVELEKQLLENQKTVQLLDEKISQLEQRLQSVEGALAEKEPRQEWKIEPLAVITE